MIGLKSIFEPSSLEEWVVQLKKDLKGADFAALFRKDEVEQMTYPTFFHAESNKIIPQSPGEFPFTRGNKTSKNDWYNGHLIIVKDEKEANQKTLEILMKGCDLIIFDIRKNTSYDWTLLFNDILLDYIKVQFILDKEEQFVSLHNHFGKKFPASISFNIDFLTIENNDLFEAVVKYASKEQISFCLVNGFEIQQCGATTWQEIAFCISTGHEYLLKLMQAGFSIDEALACIHFSIGIGSNYFIEIAKIRALRQVWAAVIREYNPAHSSSYYCSINAHIGFINKSLIDPYTNLLRQTTEAMSAISGGIDSLVIHPYDSISENGTSTLSERMALNISLILKEESYFDGAVDPLGGSYAIEELTQKIAKHSWEYFQELDDKGGMYNEEAIEFLKNAVKEKAALRIQEVIFKDKTLIGINKYMNSKPENNHFIQTDEYFGMQKLIFERELIATI